MDFKDKLIYILLEAAKEGDDDIHSAFTAEGKTTGADVYATTGKLAHWREKARQNPRAKPGEEGYTRKMYPRNVNPDFPGEAAGQHKRGERVVRRVIRAGERVRAHRDTEREARGDREGIAHKSIPAGWIRKSVPRVDDRKPKGKYSDTNIYGTPKSKYDDQVMGYSDVDDKFIYPKGKKQARVAARSGAEQGASRARREKQ